MALKAKHIERRWHYVIKGAAGRAEEIYTAAAHVLDETKPPAVTYRRETLRAGTLVTGKRYDFLVVSNRHLPDHNIYLLAFDYGTSLFTAWFLTVQPTLLKRILAFYIRLTFFFRVKVQAHLLATLMDIPKQMESSAYVAIVEDAAHQAVQMLMGQLGQDFSKVDTKSKGFLEIW